MDKKLKIGVIGAGRIGKIHARNIAKLNNVELISIADINVEAAKDLAIKVGAKKYFSDFLKVINDDEIDAVVICSPTNTHAKLIIESAKAGKDIFCEKPIDFDIEVIKKALEVVKECGVKLQLGFNRRFDHNFKKIKELIQNDELGKPHIIKITSRDPKAPPPEYVKTSGGIFMDMTIHDFDMARYLANSEVEEVFAVGNVLINPEFEELHDFDTAVITLKFKNNAVCLIDNSRETSYGYDQRIEYFGIKGCAIAQNDKPTNTIILNEKGVLSDKPLYFFLERYMKSFEEEIKEFVNSVLNGKNVPVSGEDGLKATLIAKAALISARENRPVKMEELL
ncbi:myo-inositol 2-dehydrogenase [Marinitoga hydrogenitolerans DSM 16785]|uniref:Myo-inositol 2-dehydrogenase n=1 Tax=Marinitoga hydrogenitolerans (strain DSM 16785 / JCM 12826 / AT1271) TaxID=1122195 RepID=A0A1M4SIA5_MARH1|nr:inositol 2-dehydrogenase [Marinitoga hydrogenitolerans]SHE31919.1 myo-inositol 2-dehydrogenase [Marinitoga hydrogenitolerans DSM 16785]